MQSSIGKVFAGVTLVALLATSGCEGPTGRTNLARTQPPDPGEMTLKLAEPKNGRSRPLVVVLAENTGTETTDFIVPYGVLKESKVADVVTVSSDPGTVTLIPALRVRADMTLAQFDAETPAGADFVIVPAMKRNDSPDVLNWVRAQSEKGAAFVSICEGAWVVANAGLLEGKSATTHWFALESIAKQFPGTTWVRNSRWVVSRNVMTTTGVSASIPASLALVASIAGRPAAERTAKGLGVNSWTIEHNTSEFSWTAKHVTVAVTNWLAWWRHETVEMPIEGGFDEISLAIAADTWSRTFRSQASATGASGILQSRRGLHIETEVASSHPHFTLPKSTSAKALAGIEALDDVANRYGDATADLVALGLEQRRSKSRHWD
jgi:transcriptional regulator GlxA family with amidase domain